MYSTEPAFRYFSYGKYVASGVTQYRVRLTQSLGRKTIGLGGDEFVAFNLAHELHRMIDCWVAKDEPINLTALRDYAKEQVRSRKPSVLGELRVIEKGGLIDLWDKYEAFHRKGGHWTQSYLYTHIQTARNLIQECPSQRLEDKAEIFSFIFDSEKRSVATSKSRFKLIVACIDWNSKVGNIPRRWGLEYRDLLSGVKDTKNSNDRDFPLDDGIDIFSSSEVENILDCFINESCRGRIRKGTHRQYYPFARFLWLTGCRPNEAIALQWEHIDLRAKKIIFQEGQMVVSGRYIHKKGLKTQRSRTFKINKDLEELLLILHPQEKGYIFSRKDGKPITLQGFRGVWKRILKDLGLRYRPPYQLRHSMISYHANNGFPLHHLAELVGNSEEVIREHYYHLDIEQINLPNIEL